MQENVKTSHLNVYLFSSNRKTGNIYMDYVVPMLVYESGNAHYISVLWRILEMEERDFTTVLEF